MMKVERETQTLREGADDARAGIPSRAGEFQTVGQQLAYKRGYENPNVADQPDVGPKAIRTIAGNLRVSAQGAMWFVVSAEGRRLSEGFHHIVPTVTAGDLVCTVECSLGAKKGRLVLDVEGHPVGRVDWL